jgi:two-component system NarL family response regulator
MRKAIRILVVEDHPLMRIGLVTALKQQPDMAVVGEASTVKQGLDLYAKHKPDIVMMDLRLPDQSGEGGISQLRQAAPEAKVIVLSTYDAQEHVFRCLQAGARAYLSKDVPLDELLQAIRTVNSGQNYLPAVIGAKLVERMGAPELSGREIEILRRVVRGQTNKEIASAFSISENTVKDHVSSIFSKLKATDRTQASMIAIQRGYVDLA